MESYKKLLTLIIVVLMSTFNSFSQEEENDVQLKSLQLTEEQKELLKEQQALTKELRENIKSNLTPEQKKILSNKELSRSERTKLLRKSLSVKQLNNLKDNQRLLRDKRIKFRKTITKKQMVRFRQFVRDKNTRDRKRLVRRLKRLIRENIDRQ